MASAASAPGTAAIATDPRELTTPVASSPPEMAIAARKTL